MIINLLLDYLGHGICMFIYHCLPAINHADKSTNHLIGRGRVMKQQLLRLLTLNVECDVAHYWWYGWRDVEVDLASVGSTVIIPGQIGQFQVVEASVMHPVFFSCFNHLPVAIPSTNQVGTT